MSKYTIGIDFGTLSGRAVLVDVSDGTVIGSKVSEYRHGVMDHTLPDGTPLPDDWALQHPQDYLDVLEETIPPLLASCGTSPSDVIAIGIDFTSSTTLPVDEGGKPLCFYDKFKHNPHAYAKLWKHHAAQKQANRIADVAMSRNESWFPFYGNKVSSEYSFPKLLQVLEEAPDLYDEMDSWVEAGDWIVEVLCGKRTQSACAAGYKSFYRAGEGFPSSGFFEQINPKLKNVVSDKLHGPVLPVCSKAGVVTKQAAARFGLSQGTAVAVSMIDAHAGLPAAGICQKGQMLAILGTSACYITLGHDAVAVPGISGAVDDGILPGSCGYEAGQSCVGDLFSWFADRCVPVSYISHAAEENVTVQQYLTQLASALNPGSSGLLALDWWNGNRSILMDSDLSGMLIGMTLNTKPEEIYRALIEATAFGARTIVENYKKHGIPVHTIYASGGICHKNEMLMQIYADVLQMPVHVISASEGAALGSAIIAASVVSTECGGYNSVHSAIHRMCATISKTYHPIHAHSLIYNDLFALYQSLHDFFGTDRNDFMHQLKTLRQTCR